MKEHTVTLHRKRKRRYPLDCLGEFTDAQGRVCPCKVVGTYGRKECKMLCITYWNRTFGHVVRRGYIPAENFRPDL